MRLTDKIVIRKIGNDTVAIRVDTDTVDLTSAMVLNSTSQLLFEALAQDTDEEKLVKLLLDSYDITRDKAEKDVKAFLTYLGGKDLLIL